MPYPPDAWGTLADDLLDRLEELPAGAGDFQREYRRRRVADFAILALEQAGRAEEIIPLCEREAREGGSYQRVVERLLAAGRGAEAEQWAHTGIAATARQYPGVASALREVVCTLCEQAGDWAMVAALFLRKLRRVWAQRGKVVEWRGYVEQLRATNKRKRRLVETLDVLLQERG